MGNEGVQDIVPVIRFVASTDDAELSSRERNTVKKLVDLSEDDPAQVLDITSHLQALLLHEDTKIREHAAHTVRNIARTHPEEAQNLHDEIRQLLSDDAVAVRKHTIQALEYLSREYPHKSWEAVADIIPLHADDDRKVRQGTDWVLDNLLDDQPEDMQEITHSLRPLLTKNNVKIKQHTAHVLAKISTEHPDDVRSILSTLRSTLSESDTKTRQYSIQVIKNISAESPETVQKIITDLRPLLSDNNKKVIETTTQILNNISVEYPLLEQNAAQAITKAKKAQSQNEYGIAEKHYSIAIDKLEQASAAAESFDNTDDQELQNKIEVIEEQLEKAENAREQRAAIRETLQTAERNFQEAIIRFAADSHTVSKTRFRQARDGFKDAQELLTESDEPMLTSPIDVSVEQRVEFPSPELEDYHSLGETAIDGLSSANISHVSDLEPDRQNIMPAVVANLRDTDTISKEETILLTLLSWWGGDTEHAFGSETAISRRYKQADFGFSKSR
jgi:DNA-directed RNA polymerase subunit F